MTREEIRQEALKAEKESFPRCAGDPENSFHGVTSAYGLGFAEVAFMCIIEDAWEWATTIKVSHWMPIPKLPEQIKD